MSKDTKQKNEGEAPIVGVDGMQYPSLSIDWEVYASYLDENDLTDDQKREFIETLWNIVVAFVDLGFGIHPVQQACEQDGENDLNLTADLLSYLKDIPDNQTHNLADHADAHGRADQEDS